MKRTFLMSLIAFVLLSVNGQAQNQMKAKNGNKERREKIFEKKLAFLKKNLELNDKESREFEKVFKEYTKKKLKLKKAYNKEIFQQVKKDKLPDLNDEEKENIIKRKMELDKQMYQVDTKFLNQLREILPADKVIRYFILERKFKDKLMRRVVRHRKAMQQRRQMKYRPGEKMMTPEH